MAYTIASLDELGEGYGFRKIRAALGVTAFGVNALVFPPDYDGPAHYHDMQDELYFVHRGTATLRVRRRRAHRRRRRARPRRVDDAPKGLELGATSDLVLFIVGGKDGYVERDGQLVSAEDLAKRQGALAMNGLMMDYQLTLPILLRRARRSSATRRSSRGCPTRASTATPTASSARRAKRLAVGAAGSSGSSAATASRRSAGTTTSTSRRTSGSRAAASCSTRSTCGCTRTTSRTSRTHAGDKAVIVDRSLLPLLDQFRDETPIEHVFVVEDSYEELLARRRPRRLDRPRARRERGRGDVLHERHDRHAEGRRLLAPLDDPAHARRRRGQPAGLGISEQDAILPVVPMFHANAWGYPYLATMLGAKLVFPGPHLDPESLLDDFVAGARDVDGRRADDLARHPRDARREPRAARTCRAEGDARRRLGGAARDDRRLQAAPRAERSCTAGG